MKENKVKKKIFLDTFVTVQRPAFLEPHVAEVINKIKFNKFNNLCIFTDFIQMGSIKMLRDIFKNPGEWGINVIDIHSLSRIILNPRLPNRQAGPHLT